MTDEGKKRYGYKGKKAAKPAAVQFKGGQEEIKDYPFVYDQLKSKKWIISREKFIDFAGKKFGGNERASLKLGSEIIVTGNGWKIPTNEEYIHTMKLTKLYFKWK